MAKILYKNVYYNKGCEKPKSENLNIRKSQKGGRKCQKTQSAGRGNRQNTLPNRTKRPKSHDKHQSQLFIYINI